MVDFLQTVVALIFTISILVTVHEYGHYWVAKLCNVHVIRFSVGFGKSIYSKKGAQKTYDEVPVFDENGNRVPVLARSNEPLAPTEFVLAAIPLGGYVKMLDEREAYVADDQVHLAFNRKTVWQRIAIVSAGPMANFILAILAYWVLFASGVTGVIPVLGELEVTSAASKSGLRRGQEIVAIDGEDVETWNDVNLRLFNRIGETGNVVITAVDTGSSGASANYSIPLVEWLSKSDAPAPARELGLTMRQPKFFAVIGGLVDDGRAKASGVEVGDRVLSVESVSIKDWSHLVEVIQENPERTLNIVVQRESQTLELFLRPKGINREGKTVGFIGASPKATVFPAEMLRETRHPIYLAWIPAVKRTWEVTLFTLSSIKKMIEGVISPKNLSGPITIAQVASATAESGFESFVGFIALLSISLGVINLLPIPVLDGGHLLYYLIELIAGKPVPEKVQMLGLQVGMFLIMSVMVLALYNDITRL